MSKNLLSRYIWIIDTIRKHGAITRDELNARWRNSPFYNGEDLPRRTFYNYRNAIEELFNVNIECNPATYEYFIRGANANEESMTDWLLNSAATNSVLTDARDMSYRIFIEDVPSARNYLAPVMSAMRESRIIRFAYRPYTRTTPSPDVLLEPYFLKIFRQRWYITGKNRQDAKIKTYALDRMTSLSVEDEEFEYPLDFDAEKFARDSFGIIFSHDDPCTVKVKTDPTQAKYFRALPLHRSQHEVLHDSYSIFTYKVRLTSDFLQELLSYGDRIEVIEPEELRYMMADSLRRSLEMYARPAEPADAALQEAQPAAPPAAKEEQQPRGASVRSRRTRARE